MSWSLSQCGRKNFLKKAVGYIRGRLWRRAWAPDTGLQRQQIKDFAEIEGYEPPTILGEQQNFSMRRKGIYPKLTEALNLCEKHSADFLYVDIGNWRTNPVLNQYIAHKPGTKSGWKFIGIRPDRETIEAVERQGRLEKYANKRRRALKPKLQDEKGRDNIPPIMIWKRDNEISSKRFKNFEHLYEGVEPIYRLLRGNWDSSNKKIADELHKKAYLTVDGRRWSEDNVRKTRALITSPEFLEFVDMREEEKQDWYLPTNRSLYITVVQKLQ